MEFEYKRSEPGCERSVHPKEQKRREGKKRREEERKSKRKREFTEEAAEKVIESDCFN